MSNLAFKVDNISKAYLIGLEETRHDTLGGTFLSWIKSPVRNYGILKKLNTFTNQQESEDLFWALKNVSFEVKHGDVLGIIGPNGAGKSTLLKILSKITHPTKGRAEVFGRVASLLEVGTGFHTDLTGRENIFLNGTILGMTKKEIEKKFDEIVDFSGIEKFIDTQVKKYSTGMRIRLAFSVASVIDTEILIIDEVLSVGDQEFQRKSLDKMENSASQGRTVLFVSHNMSAIQTLCTRGIFLNKGRIMIDSTIEETISTYTHHYAHEKSIQEWSSEEAPSNENAKLIKAEVRALNNSSKQIYSGEEFEFEFVFYNMLKDMHTLDVIFHLKDELDNLLFVGSSHSDKLNNNLTEGYLTVICRVPKNLMLQGTYSLSRLYLVMDKNHLIFEIRDVLEFEIQYDGKDIMGPISKKEGLIKPKLGWEIFATEEAEISS